MADKKEIIKEKLDHSGLFNFSDFYSFTYNWLKENKYIIVEEKYNEGLEGNKRNLYIEWKATREMSDYFKVELFFKFTVRGLTDVEVEIDGEKKNMNKGSVGVEIRGTIIKDAEGKWDRTPGWRFLRDVYNKYIIPRRVDTMDTFTAMQTTTIKEEMKAFLELTGKRN